MNAPLTGTLTGPWPRCPECCLDPSGEPVPSGDGEAPFLGLVVDHQSDDEGVIATLVCEYCEYERDVDVRWAP